MRILFLPKYDYSGASSRYRTWQFIPYFRERGIVCDVVPFFDYKHIQSINNSNRGTRVSFIRSVIERFKVLLSRDKYDFLLIEKELIPYFPPIIENILHQKRIKYILDYDDAIFHHYDEHGKPLIRSFLHSKIPNIIHNASAIIAGSQYLKMFAQKYNEQVFHIPTVVNHHKYQNVNPVKEHVIGWIGSFYTSNYLDLVWPALEKLLPELDIRLHLIGFNKSLLPDSLKSYTEVVEWNEETEINELFRFRVGIAPLHDTPFTRGKCAFKAIQYMSCGTPVVCAPVGANGEVVIHNQTGYHANSDDDWYNYLKVLIEDNEKNDIFGRESRKLVEDRYCIDAVIEKYMTIFQSMV